MTGEDTEQRAGARHRINAPVYLRTAQGASTWAVATNASEQGVFVLTHLQPETDALIYLELPLSPEPSAGTVEVSGRVRRVSAAGFALEWDAPESPAVQAWLSRFRIVVERH